MRLSAFPAGFILGAILLGGIGVSCGDDDTSPAGGSPDPAITPNPAVSPSPTPSPSGTPGPQIRWASVFEQRSCPFPECPAGQGFRVSRDGDFSSGSGPTGVLTDTELAVLRVAVDLVADQDLTEDPVCSSLSILPGQSLYRFTLERDDGSEVLVFEDQESDGVTCIRGDEARARALQSVVDDLAEKYSLPTLPPV